MTIAPGALKSECQTDPAGLGLAAPFAAGTFSVVLAALNASRGTEKQDRALVPTWELWEAIVPAEWASLSAAEKQRLQTMLSLGSVNLRGSNTRASLLAMFGSSTTTRANLVALQKRDGSRAETLFGSAVTLEDLAAARSA